MRAGEGDIFGIGDQRPGGGAVEAVEIIVDDRQIALPLDQRRPAPRLGLDPGAQAQGQGVGVGGQAVLGDVLVTQARFAAR